MRRFSAAGFMVALLLLASCKTVAPPPPEPTIPPNERAFLLDPTVSAPSVESTLKAQIQSAYQSFERGARPAEVAALAAKILAGAPDSPPALVLAAEAEYLEGRFAEAAQRLQPLREKEPAYVAAGLVAGRSLERLGESLAAFEAFRAISDLDATSAFKADELRKPALEKLAGLSRDAIAAGRLEEAEAIAARLEALAPAEKLTLETHLEIAKARGLEREELSLLRQLARLDGARAVRERLGDLEVKIGDVKAGLEIFESLSRQEPDDPALVAQVERAKFRWRLERLPARVQAITRKAELTRADLASLLFWLLPQVQHSPAVDPPIASDILNHPAQQEILRVTDLELMEVDETLHRFNPDVATTRRASLASLLSLLVRQRAPCILGEKLTRDSRTWVCRKSVECGLLGDESQCQPSAPISGSDAVDLMKVCLDLLGDA